MISLKRGFFSILPLQYNLLLRKKFLSFAASLQSHRNTLPTQVGVDPYSREWGEIYQRLRAVNNVAVNCDYSSFDGLLTSQVLSHIGHAINRIYGDSDISKNQRHNLLMAIINRRSICGSQVYEVAAGIPSGCALTVLLNSVFNEFLIRYVWKTTIVGVARERFSKYVCLIVYGDDNLIAVHPDFLPRFNGQRIQDALAEIKVGITDGTDKTAIGIKEKPLAHLDFLKRRFKKLPTGIVLAPLDLSSIFTSLQNVTLGAGSIPLAVKQNVHTALTELYLHQREDWYNHLRNFYVTNHSWKDLPMWAETHSFHREHMTGVAPWAPCRFFDIPVDGEELKAAMANQGNHSFCTQLGERLFVCGHGWQLTDPENQYVVSMIPLKRGEVNCGAFVPVEFGTEGRGRLPTLQWVKKFRSPRHGVNTCTKAQYADGRNIYFRGDAPFVANWCAAISFAQSLQMDIMAMQNLYHNVCTPGSKSIYEYFSEAQRKPIDRYVPPPIVARMRGDMRYS